MSRPTVFQLLLAGLTASAWLYTRRRSRLRRIDNERILVVGASSGVGREIALEYAKRKDVILILIARGPLDATVQECLLAGCTEVIGIQADASDSKDVARLLKSIERASSRLDTVICCAGALTVKPMLALSQQTTSNRPQQLSPLLVDAGHLAYTAEIMQKSYNANVTSVLLICLATAPLLLQSSKPRIAVLSSVAAEIPAPTRALYGANKAALSMLMRSLRIEFRNLRTSASSSGSPKPIGITLIYPASINTGLRAGALDNISLAEKSNSAAEVKAMTPTYVAKQTIQSIAEEKDELWLPASYWWIAKIAQLTIPNMIERGAVKKYGFV